MSTDDTSQPPSRPATVFTVGTDVWGLLEALQDRDAFRTECGLLGKGLLDFPGGFRFSPPRGVAEAAFQRHHVDAPDFTVWSDPHIRGPRAGSGTYAVAWHGETCGWVFPDLADDAAVEVRRHQWLLRSLLTHELPEMRKGVDY